MTADWDLPRERAIPKLVQLHGGRLFGLGLRMCGSREDAEDVVQETFLQAYRKWDQFEGRSDPKSWLYTIASRVCRRHHRLRSGEPRHLASYDELLPSGVGPVGAPSPAAEGLDELIRQESVERVEAAIAELPLAFRLPVVLKEIVGFPVAEVAGILGLKPATVKTRLHRARLRIRQALEQCLPKRDFPPPPYSKQVCLDLLHAKQEALDHGVELPVDVVCERCRAVFDQLDLAQDICRLIGDDELPESLRQAITARLGS